MATGRAALTDQIFEDLPVADAHQSFNTRLSKLYDKITFLCSGQAKEQCQDYKTLVHPHLPDVSPLSLSDANFGRSTVRFMASAGRLDTAVVSCPSVADKVSHSQYNHPTFDSNLTNLKWTKIGSPFRLTNSLRLGRDRH